MKYIFVVIAFFLSACSDNAVVNVFDKTFTHNKVECMRLLVFPPDETISNTLKDMYRFYENCDIVLEVSKKDGITCNSNQNYEKKALDGFPTSYLKLQITKNKKLLYSYYIDLQKSVTKEDVAKAFQRIESDLILE